MTSRAPDATARKSVLATPAPHRLAVRVYYEDTDFSGVVYHASYLRFFERGRTEFLRAIGIEHKVIFGVGGSDARHFVVRRMAIDFVRPALMDDSLLVETSVCGLGGASIEMAQQILREAEVLVTATVKIGLVSGGKARRLPGDLAAKLAASPIAPTGTPLRRE